MACWTSKLDITIPSNFEYNILEISGKCHHACGFNTKYKLACWGIDSAGEILIPDYIDHVNYISTGLYITCALVNDNFNLNCWGIHQIILKNNNKRIKNIIIGS